MAVQVSRLGAASTTVQQTLSQATQGLDHRDTLADLEDTEWSDSAWGFYNSTNELLSGLEVTEYPAPAALTGWLQDEAKK
jgi:hypothetical protein